MKRGLLILIAVVMVAGSAYADNQARIDVLMQEAERCQKEIQKSRQIIRNNEIRLFKIDGAIGELQKLDKEQKEVPDDSK